MQANRHNTPRVFAARDWPLTAAVAFTLLFAGLSVVLFLTPVQVVATGAINPDLAMSKAGGSTCQLGQPGDFAWGLGAGVVLTALFFVSPFPRLRHK